MSPNLSPSPSTSGPFTQFPGTGLAPPTRHITGYNSAGQSVFIRSDQGSHHAVLVDGAAAQNIVYSTQSNPVELGFDEGVGTGGKKNDVEMAEEFVPGLHIPHGTIVRQIDFAPGAVSVMHRSLCLAYGTVCEGEFEMALDGGETKVLRPGDVVVNRAGMHQWRNVTAGGTKAGRMLFVILDVGGV
ncbi:cupin domain-containing protein, partial [Usnea florida]